MVDTPYTNKRTMLFPLTNLLRFYCEKVTLGVGLPPSVPKGPHT